MGGPNSSHRRSPRSGRGTQSAQGLRPSSGPRSQFHPAPARRGQCAALPNPLDRTRPRLDNVQLNPLQPSWKNGLPLCPCGGFLACSPSRAVSNVTQCRSTLRGTGASLSELLDRPWCSEEKKVLTITHSLEWAEQRRGRLEIPPRIAPPKDFVKGSRQS